MRRRMPAIPGSDRISDPEMTCASQNEGLRENRDAASSSRPLSDK
jgi:hypothetical protein